MDDIYHNYIILDFPKKIFLGKTSFVDHSILIFLIFISFNPNNNIKYLTRKTISNLQFFLVIHVLLMKT